jgi:hypothetical protein
MPDAAEIASPQKDSITDHYGNLCEALQSIETAVEANTLDQLEAGKMALVAVLTFLNSDPEIVLKGSNRSLSIVLRTLNDVLGGGRPALLFERPSKGGAPNYQSDTVLRAQIVLALELLLKAGLSRDEAGAWVARQLEKSKIRRAKGKHGSITAKEILRWRSEKGGKAPSGFDAAFTKLERRISRHDWPNEPKTAKQRAAALIHALKKNLGF